MHLQDEDDGENTSVIQPLLLIAGMAQDGAEQGFDGAGRRQFRWTGFPSAAPVKSLDVLPGFSGLGAPVWCRVRVEKTNMPPLWRTGPSYLDEAAEDGNSAVQVPGRCGQDGTCKSLRPRPESNDPQKAHVRRRGSQGLSARRGTMGLLHKILSRHSMLFAFSFPFHILITLWKTYFFYTMGPLTQTKGHRHYHDDVPHQPCGSRRDAISCLLVHMTLFCSILQFLVFHIYGSTAPCSYVYILICVHIHRLNCCHMVLITICLHMRCLFRFLCFCFMAIIYVNTCGITMLVWWCCFNWPVDIWCLMISFCMPLPLSYHILP